MLPMTHTPTSITDDKSSGGRLVSVDGRELPLKSAKLTTDARGGIARVVLEQRFFNPYAEPLTVSYQVPLPHDGAVSGYAFLIGDERIVGEVDKKSRARERFEEAIVSGHTAAILEEDRSSLFTQEVGNIPPKTEVVIEIFVDQRLRWLDEGSWEWRFPTVVAPRYLGAEGRVPDASRVTVDVADGAISPKLGFELTIRDAVANGRTPDSPSHALAVNSGRKKTTVGLRSESGASLDRDLVVHWPVSTPKVGIELDAARPARGHAHADEAHALLTIVPPTRDPNAAAVARDLIVLLDTSGSMHGSPINQAKRVVASMIDTLGDQDQLEMIEFSMAPHRWKRSPVTTTAKAKKAAHKWLAGLEAGGGTEMRQGIYEALRPLRKKAQRQVILITDGLIGFEQEIVQTVCDKLPKGSRLHTIGVGSGVNRSLTGPAARAGRGIEVVIGLDEDAEKAASRIVTATDAPLVVDLEIGGEALFAHAPEHLPDLFAGAPALISLALDPEGGPLTIRGRTASGTFTEEIEIDPIESGSGTPAVTALFARETVEDLETRIAAGKNRSKCDARIEMIGLEFQISTRLTTWVAVSRNKTVDPRDPTRKEKVPHELPYGMSVEGLGLRPAMAPAPMQPQGVMRSMPASAAPPPMKKGKAKRSRRRKDDSPSTRTGGGGFGAEDFDDELDGDFAESAGDFLDSAESFEQEESYDAPEEAKAEAPTSLLDELRSMDPSSVEPEPEDRKEADKTVAHRPRRLVAQVLSAIVAFFKNGVITLEATAHAALDWDPDSTVEATDADGNSVAAEVLLDRSTRAGTVQPGQVLRLTLDLANFEGELTQVVVHTPDGPVELNIRRD